MESDRLYDLHLGKIESSFEQVPFHPIVLDRLDKGTACLNEFAKIMTSNLESIQKQITSLSNISRTHIYDLEIVDSGLEKSLGHFKNYHLFMAKEQVQYYKTLGEEILKNIEEVRANRISIANKHKSDTANYDREVAFSIDALDKSKKQFAKAFLDFVNQKEKLKLLENEVEKLNEDKKANSRDFMSKMLSAFESTPSQDRDKQLRRVEKRFNLIVMYSIDIKKRKRILKEQMHAKDVSIAQVLNY